jgi:hypothetical protein
MGNVLTQAGLPAIFGFLGVPQVVPRIARGPTKIRNALPLLAIAAALGCGDPQLDQSRREPFFVALETWENQYAPGLTVLTPFPNLQQLTAPRFVSSDPSTAGVSLRSDSDSGESQLLLTTGAPGEAEIQLYDGKVLVQSESVRVIRPTRFGFDFTIQNRLAPEEVALGQEEPIAVVEAARVQATVKFFGIDESSGSSEVIVGSGRVAGTVDILLDIVPRPNLPIGTGGGELRFNQLTTGDLVSMVASNSNPVVVLEIPNGERLFLKPFEGLVVTAPFALELVVAKRPSMERADIAVYGRFYPFDPSAETLRVLGLSPIVTLNGEPLQPVFSVIDLDRWDFIRTWPWLFNLPADAEGVVEAKWQTQTQAVNLCTLTVDPNTTLWVSSGLTVISDECGYFVENQPLSFAIETEDSTLTIESRPGASPFPGAGLFASTEAYSPTADEVTVTGQFTNTAFSPCEVRLDDRFELVLDNPNVSLEENETLSVTWTHGEEELSVDECVGNWLSDLPCAGVAMFALAREGPTEPSERACQRRQDDSTRNVIGP